MGNNSAVIKRAAPAFQLCVGIDVLQCVVVVCCDFLQMCFYSDAMTMEKILMERLFVVCTILCHCRTVVTVDTSHREKKFSLLVSYLKGGGCKNNKN